MSPVLLFLSILSIHRSFFFYSWPVSTLCFFCLSVTFFPSFLALRLRPPYSAFMFSFTSKYITFSLLCTLFLLFFLLPSLLIPSCLAFSSPLCFRLTVPSSLWNNSRGCLRLLPTTVADCINIACHCLIDHRNARNTELATRQVSG